jgi:alpha-L-fucosidase
MSSPINEDEVAYAGQFLGAQSEEPDGQLTLPWRATPASLAWWQDAKLGMFVHFGVSALEGVELSWGRDLPRPFDIQGVVQHPGEEPQRVPHDVYDSLFTHFDPKGFDADAWVSVAEGAGAGYIVLTAKHHDGFCLWDTAETDYKITSPQSPFGRDLVRELADACHARGMRFGIYYSPRDWHHPDYLMAGNRDYQRYMNAQLRELLGNYGAVDILWFDSYGYSDIEADWDAASTIELARELQPGIVINNRLAVLNFYNEGPVRFWGDFDTPEQRLGSLQTGRPWESCVTLVGDQWGYRPNGEMMTFDACVRSLVTCAVRGGNLLLNVGPNAEGVIEGRQVERLSELGSWLAAHRDTIIGTRAYPIPDARWGGATTADDTIYAHVLDAAPQIFVPLSDDGPVTVRHRDGRAATFDRKPAGVVISLATTDVTAPDTILMIEAESGHSLVLSEMDAIGSRRESAT